MQVEHIVQICRWCLIIQSCSNLLETHPVQLPVNFFLAGISQGFHIGYHNPKSSLKSAKRNLHCALQHPEVIHKDVKTWLKKRDTKKRISLSLVGLLHHATKVVKPDRTFVSQKNATAARAKKLSQRTTLTAEFKSDLHWWHLFVTPHVLLTRKYLWLLTMD